LYGRRLYSRQANLTKSIFFPLGFKNRVGGL
jgi:hypothetical protein